MSVGGLDRDVLFKGVGLATSRDHVMAEGLWGLAALVAPKMWVEFSELRWSKERELIWR